MTRYLTIAYPRDGGAPEVLFGPEIPRREQNERCKREREKGSVQFKRLETVRITPDTKYRLRTPEEIASGLRAEQPEGQRDFYAPQGTGEALESQGSPSPAANPGKRKKVAESGEPE